MRGLAFAVAVGAALVGAAIAHAGTVTLSGDTLSYDAAPGEANRVFVVQDPDGMHVIDLGATVTAGAGCTSVNANEGFCAADSPQSLNIQVAADDMNDYVDLEPAGVFVNSFLDGGAGNDTLIGGNASNGNTFDGGLGADTFSGRGTVDYSTRTNPVTVTIGDGLANDGEAGEHDLVPNEISRVVGGHAGDTLTTLDAPNVGFTFLVGGDGNDHLTIKRRILIGQMDGNAGKDVLRAPASDAVMHGGDGDDLLVGGSLGQALWGDNGDDILRGNGGRDRLIGGAGADQISGGPGRDSVSAGTGPDTIYARDQKRDVLDGGPGEDRARVDVGLDRLISIEVLF